MLSPDSIFTVSIVEETVLHHDDGEDFDHEYDHLFEDEEMDLGELLAHTQNFGINSTSDSHINLFTWFNSTYELQDFRTGEILTHSLFVQKINGKPPTIEELTAIWNLIRGKTQ